MNYPANIFWPRAIKLARILFPAPKWPENNWADDGWGGVDEKIVAKRQEEKAKVIVDTLFNTADEDRTTCALMRCWLFQAGTREGGELLTDSNESVQTLVARIREDLKQHKKPVKLRIKWEIVPGEK